jgi:hypothetical protein
LLPPVETVPALAAWGVAQECEPQTIYPIWIDMIDIDLSEPLGMIHNDSPET